VKTLMARITLPAAALLCGVPALGGDLEGAASESETVYRVFNLESSGGPLSAGNSINNLGLVSGFSEEPEGQFRHATLWFYGLKVDLGTLGGLNSNIPWPAKNTRGLIVGIAQTATPDPLGERWSCRSFFTFATRFGPTCLGFVWEPGRGMKPLPTFDGGNNGFATGANNFGQVVGWAENGVHDSSCVAPQVLQFRAALWEPRKNRMRQLRPLGNDATSAATAINDKGQVVGISGACGTAVGGFSAEHAVMWENGVPKPSPHLGGVAWNTPMAINELGDVAGFSNRSPDVGNAIDWHAYFVPSGATVATDLDVLDGHDISQGLGLNESRQVVGQSCTADFVDCKAFLWEHGVLKDLNDLVAPGYDDVLIAANDINDRGWITGAALSTQTGQQVTFIAYPVPRHSLSSDAAAASAARAGGYRTPAVVLPAEVRRQMKARLGIQTD
jgi:probable HAF family extracellular repeat protein